jgi:Kef-type K+ transport system membrane component KefB
MIETRLSDTSMGKMILAACFINDLGTVLALGVLFANFNIWMIVFVIVLCIVLWFMPRWTKYLIGHLGTNKVSQPEVKFILLVLFLLGGLATTAKSEAVLPAYLIGLVVAGVFIRDKTLVDRMRTIALLFLHRFIFIKAGCMFRCHLYGFIWYYSNIACYQNVYQIVGVYPLARIFQCEKGKLTIPLY